MFKKKELDLEKIYNENKHAFELLLIKDFTGYIPKDVQEPALKMFKEYGEVFERWSLWQSWYVNNRLINDPLKISFYHGMMLYLKTLNTMAKIHKKNFQPERPIIKDVEVAPSYLENALDGISEFYGNIKNYKADKDKDPEDIKV
jgi:hypothetical protein